MFVWNAVNGFDKIRDWLVDMFFPVVVIAGFVICLLFPVCAQPLGEAGGLIAWPFLGMWLTTCALVMAHAHRAISHSLNPLIQFGGPIAAGVLYAIVTVWAGGAAGFWLVAHMPAAFR